MHKATILSPLSNKNHDARQSFTIDTRNLSQPLQNVIEGQSNNNGLNMVQERTNNPQNDRTMAAKNSNEKLPSSTVTLPTIILLHLM